MRIAFLRSSGAGVKWFNRYYRVRFPEGASRAAARMQRALAILRDNPEIGHLTPEPPLRQLTIPNTPFHLIYRVAADRIEILRVIDGRANAQLTPYLDSLDE